MLAILGRSSQDTHLPLDEHEVLTQGHPGHLTPSEAATLDALRQIVDPDHINQVQKVSYKAHIVRKWCDHNFLLISAGQVRGGERRCGALQVFESKKI
jgi:hypothetical protein